MGGFAFNMQALGVRAPVGSDPGVCFYSTRKTAVKDAKASAQPIEDP
jgi:hypothetical protein